MKCYVDLTEPVGLYVCVKHSQNQNANPKIIRFTYNIHYCPRQIGIENHHNRFDRKKVIHPNVRQPRINLIFFNEQHFQACYYILKLMCISWPSVYLCRRP